MLGFVITTPWVLLGAGLLIACRHRPDMTKPVWEYGETMLLLSAINFAILVGLATQVRRLKQLLAAQAQASSPAPPVIGASSEEA